MRTRSIPSTARRLSLIVGAGAGAVTAALWTLGATSGPLQTVTQAGTGLVVGALVAAATVAAWSRALPRRVVHAVGMVTCWAVATGMLLAATGEPIGSAVLSLPSLFLGLAITMPVLVTLEVGTSREARA